jgi:hypothetical protein
MSDKKSQCRRNIMSETLLLLGGIYNLLFAVFHLLFWRIFNWKEDLASLTSLNRAIMQVLNLCLTFVFVIFGVVSLLYPAQMVGTELGRALTVMIAFFWFLRAVEQVIFFKLKNWVSWTFLLVFIGGGVLYGLVPFVV